MTDRLIFEEHQGVDEEIIYRFITTEWGSSPTSISAVAKDDLNKSDKTTVVFPTNAPAAVGDLISLSPLKSLVEGTKYRIEVKFTAGGSIFELYGYVTAKL